jgi:predicted transcriptional regulator
VTDDDTQVMSIRLPKDLHERLRRAAFDRREPMNAIIARGAERELSALARRDPVTNRAGRQTQGEPRSDISEERQQ